MSDHVLIDREAFEADLKTKSHESWHHSGCELHPDEVCRILDDHVVSDDWVKVEDTDYGLEDSDATK